jgi:hypothetical protein
MCIVLDVNVFPEFFDSKNPSYNSYNKLRKWIFKGNGKLIFGGTKYREEVGQVKTYISVLAALDRAGKIVQLDDAAVDRIQTEVRAIEKSTKFDDPHLVAIVLCSKCRVICTNDVRALPYLKDLRFFKRAADRPRIYSDDKNCRLINNRNIVCVCQ